jgi:hypothetical protein
MGRGRMLGNPRIVRLTPPTLDDNG